jgi:hypothetical protein
MKTPLNNAFLKTALLLVSLTLSIGSLRIAQADSNDRLSVGLVLPVVPDFHADAAYGYLLVYSATDEFIDGAIPYNPHSSYVVYTSDGKFLRNVENHISPSDETPELVKLAPDAYTVEARSANDGYARVGVVIKPGRPTILNLDR